MKEKQIVNMRSQLRIARIEMGFLQDIRCSKAENEQFREQKKAGVSLPDDVGEYKNMNDEPSGVFYRIHDEELSDSERMEYTAYCILNNIRTIKKCCVFFTTLIILSIICAIIYWIWVFNIIH